MKKFNKNSILFLFFVIAVIAGLSGGCITGFGAETGKLFSALWKGNLYSFMEYKTNVDALSSESLTYHNFLLNVNGVKENLSGTQVIHKSDTTVVKAASGSLTIPAPKADVRESVDALKKLYDICLENDAKFLYFAAPSKQLVEELPANVENYAAENYQSFFAAMDTAGIPYVNYTQAVTTDSFYYTDHHWTIRTGLNATDALCRELHSRYGFVYNPDHTNIDNYHVELYENYFLGSYGKKVGTHFSSNGPDDFELITPKFRTKLTETRSTRKQARTGSFEDTVLYMDNLEKGYYSCNPYATYSGGDFRQQIMKNELAPDGAKVLLIRDSYACAVAPFLSLQTGELHVCDVRNYSYFEGEKINVEAYIQEIQPDYVIVLYTDVTSIEESCGRFDFF